MKNQSISLTDAQKLSAITWAANGAGLSYGQYMTGLGMDDKETIYRQYAAVLWERKEAEARMLADHAQASEKERRKQTVRTGVLP